MRIHRVVPDRLLRPSKCDITPPANSQATFIQPAFRQELSQIAYTIILDRKWREIRDNACPEQHQ